VLACGRLLGYFVDIMIVNRHRILVPHRRLGSEWATRFLRSVRTVSRVTSTASRLRLDTSLGALTSNATDANVSNKSIERLTFVNFNTYSTPEEVRQRLARTGSAIEKLTFKPPRTHRDSPCWIGTSGSSDSVAKHRLFPPGLAVLTVVRRSS